MKHIITTVLFDFKIEIIMTFDIAKLIINQHFDLSTKIYFLYILLFFLHLREYFKINIHVLDVSEASEHIVSALIFEKMAHNGTRTLKEF